MRRAATMQQQELLPMNDAPTKTKKKTAAPKVAVSKGQVATVKKVATIKRELGPVGAPKSMMQVLSEAAADPNVDATKMERLLAMQERVVAREAEIKFNEAMHDAQSHMPRVVKDKKNPETRSDYASLENVAKTINPIIYKHGFAPSFGTEDSKLPGHYKVICYLSHTGGHTRKYEADVPTDTTGPKGNKNKSETHGFGSAMSYARRYLMVLIFNVVIVGEDNDGNHANVETLSDKQAEKLVDLLESAGGKRPAFLTWASNAFKMEIKSFGQIPASRYQECETAIKNWISEQQKK